VYSSETAHGVRWRFVYRRSDGTHTTKRGFASERAATDARRRLVEQAERGEIRHAKETFGGYWGRRGLGLSTVASIAHVHCC
jgi:hypothetical protein